MGNFKSSKDRGGEKEKEKQRERGALLVFPLTDQMKESEEKAKGISLTPQKVGWGRGRPPLGGFSFFRTGEGAQGQRRLPERHTLQPAYISALHDHMTPPLRTVSSSSPPPSSQTHLRNALKIVRLQVWSGHCDVIMTTRSCAICKQVVQSAADLPDILTIPFIAHGCGLNFHELDP